MKQLFGVIFLFISFLNFQAQDSLYYKNLGIADSLFALEEYQEAYKYIRKIDGSKGFDEGYFVTKGCILLELEMIQEAYDAFSYGLDNFPENATLFNCRGNLLLEAGEFDLSIEDFTTAMEYAQDDTLMFSLYINRSAAKSMRRDFDGAYKDLMYCYERDSSDVSMLVNLSAICDEIGKGDETIKYLLRAIEVDPDFYFSYGNLGFKYQMMEEYETSNEYFFKVLEFDPNEGITHNNISYNMMKLGKLEEAMEYVEKAIELYPANSYAFRNKALILIEMEETDEACEAIERAIELGYYTSYGDDILRLKAEHCK